MAKESRLKWGSSLEAQRQADEAFRKAKATKAQAKTKGKRFKSKKPNYWEYIKSKRWANKRREALKYHGEKCNRCGSVDALQVHHKTYKRLGNERMADLEVLCNNCHCLEHEDKGTMRELQREFSAIVA